MKKLLLILTLLLCAAVPSNAALVVATCGTVPITYTAGQVRQITVDTTGKICT